SYISFEVPPLVKQKLLGWVICVFCHKHGWWGGVVFDVSVSRNKTERDGGVMVGRCCYEMQYEDLVWVRYIPQGYSGWHLEGGDEVQISIRPETIVRSEAVEWTVVRKWGVDLIYEVDENITKTNENQEALIQYTSAHDQNVSLPEDFSSDKKRRRTF
ncbi:hypothetical protein ACR8G9_22375, partial [Salmonella enterica subsp. enterica serovar Paratyphi A]